MDPIEPFRKEVENAIGLGLKAMGVDQRFEIELPPADIADFALPCFQFAKALRKSPVAIASDLASHIPKLDLVSEVWNDKGYLNFRFNEMTLVDLTLKEILTSKDAYGCWPSQGTSILLEHTSVNPTGPIHIGRARNPLIGDTLARCLRLSGYEVTTEYYVNDVGKQVVLLAWGIEHIPPSDVPQAERGKADHRLVGYYRKANELMESDPEVGEEIADMLRKFEAGDREVIEKVRRTAQTMLDGIVESLEAVGVELDDFIWESQFILDGSAKDVVERLKGTRYCVEEEGAFYLDLAEFGVHGRDTKFFFTRSDGTTLYTTRDMAYHIDKFRRADCLINILGEDQKLGMIHLASALKILGVEKVPENVFYSFVSLPEGRMSTRKGTVVTLDDLIEEAEERALGEVKKRRTDLTEEEMRVIARAIGRGSIRYNIIRVQAEKPIVFRWEEALNFEGNSAPFVQYAHARACSILRKAGAYEPKVVPSLLTDPYEKKLVRVLARFPGVVRECGEKRRIHVMPSYAHELASSFNQFYTYVPVLKAGDARDARLGLVESSMWVLRNCLRSMGLGTPEEM
ncbi:MAG: arginine--tRNA ligase [Methanomassiliicoccales archaeon]|nr:arginine--tRNA ligase [Methanomassiliicoccales archaeon]